ncbi:MAG: hypothetical protein A2284_16340 [Deltaproteobacteria bacterium RIFOXYA12_FULL_61_11]|nr:MAG: hypothetical protein A2284_16340 [Deltaproteobacteria bacterium RIFOXYA12_FULL_61_11]
MTLFGMKRSSTVALFGILLVGGLTGCGGSGYDSGTGVKAPSLDPEDPSVSSLDDPIARTAQSFPEPDADGDGQVTTEEAKAWEEQTGIDTSQLPNLAQVNNPQGDTDGDGALNYQDADPFSSALQTTDQVAAAQGLNEGGPNLMSIMQQGMGAMMMPMQMMMMYSYMKMMLGGSRGVSGETPLAVSPATAGVGGAPLPGNSLPLDAQRLIGVAFTDQSGQRIVFGEGYSFSWQRGNDSIQGTYSLLPVVGQIALVPMRSRATEVYTFSVKDAPCAQVTTWAAFPGVVGDARNGWCDHVEVLPEGTPTMAATVPLNGYNPVRGASTCAEIPATSTAGVATGDPTGMVEANKALPNTIIEIALSGISQKKNEGLKPVSFYFRRAAPTALTGRNTCNDVTMARGTSPVAATGQVAPSTIGTPAGAVAAPGLPTAPGFLPTAATPLSSSAWR